MEACELLSQKKKKEREILKEHREAQHTIHTKVMVIPGISMVYAVVYTDVEKGQFGLNLVAYLLASPSPRQIVKSLLCVSPLSKRQNS
ncbi:hypothetical protein Bca52824_030322 [Brassica carinata]|uniref:Uncharacterized protein n=1 Tax=Brassica carinata TaxID=52824 RepID=A0A8X7V6L7_BRACI|nr:hypothetical protein Bca52824_030322 [Brassica carinata]